MKFNNLEYETSAEIFENCTKKIKEIHSRLKIIKIENKH